MISIILKSLISLLKTVKSLPQILGLLWKRLPQLLAESSSWQVSFSGFVLVEIFFQEPFGIELSILSLLGNTVKLHETSDDGSPCSSKLPASATPAA